MDNAFKEIEKLGGIPTEASYPYVSGAGKKEACETSKAKVATLTGFTDVPTKSETGLVAALDKGPVSVAVEADKSVFQSYKSGVIKSILCGTNLDHGVLAVGYGTDAGTDYYKVKNSWGATWGVEGYLKIERGHNTCGIETQPSYPTGVKPLGPTPPGPTPPSAYEKQQVFDEKVSSTVSSFISFHSFIHSLTSSRFSPSPGPTPPGPTPPPPGPEPAATHYGDPYAGPCMADELNITVTGAGGAFCGASCGLFKKCPEDKPATAVGGTPDCALEDSATDKKYCALMCTPSLNGPECGTKATCKTVQAGVGICTFDS